MSAGEHAINDRAVMAIHHGKGLLSIDESRPTLTVTVAAPTAAVAAVAAVAVRV
jgi:hypothetical protein